MVSRLYVSLIILSSCGLADIRQDLTLSVRDGDNINDEKALQIVQKVYEAYGGLERWKNIRGNPLANKCGSSSWK